MSDSLYLLKQDRSLSAMTLMGFETEKEFQELLEEFPDLLTTEDFGESEARRWLFISREKRIADRAGGAGRWSIDHLFLDQDGIPTLVEVKRATDTRVRREVVAQMLEYAANAVAWWSVESMMSDFKKACDAKGEDPTEVLERRLDIKEDVEAYWKGVQANLSSGRIRLLFVADEIPRELQRIIEFLNEQMNPAVVLGLELRRFKSGDDSLISPRLVGLTEKAAQLKSITPVYGTEDPTEWIETNKAKMRLGRRQAVEKFINFLAEQGVRPVVRGGGRYLHMIAPWSTKPLFGIPTSGKLALQLSDHKNSSGGLGKEAMRKQAIERFGAISGVDLSKANADGYPSFDPAMIVASDWPRLEQEILWYLKTSKTDKADTVE